MAAPKTASRRQRVGIDVDPRCGHSKNPIKPERQTGQHERIRLEATLARTHSIQEAFAGLSEVQQRYGTVQVVPDVLHTSIGVCCLGAELLYPVQGIKEVVCPHLSGWKLLARWCALSKYSAVNCREHHAKQREERAEPKNSIPVENILTHGDANRWFGSVFCNGWIQMIWLLDRCWVLEFSVHELSSPA